MKAPSACGAGAVLVLRIRRRSRQVLREGLRDSIVDAEDVGCPDGDTKVTKSLECVEHEGISFERILKAFGSLFAIIVCAVELA
ncbi:hypothetical protein HYQ46_008014 [Verticillium longisporum]|nr:hypothetical protein HYQ46_008014 [Verticillium longisporum]